ncbi:MAG: hydroxyacid dehydrogenase [Rhizobiales bacterium]|nr:hydroxyacid dehydrogenase [Hyphomicrobiales bacterium]MBI3671945.1 hydroxyacid dehydrogenase [Hyphomicrobiales bacterium]
MSDPRPLVISIPEPRRLDLIFTKSDLELLRTRYRIVEGEAVGAEAVLRRHLPEASFIIGQPPLPRDLLQTAGHLKAIFNVETNFLDNMDYDYCFAHGIHVLTTGKVFAVPVAEIGLGLALCLERNICGADRAFRRGEEKWGGDSNAEARLLTGGNIGFIGFGDLGKALHRLLPGFRARIRVFDPWLPAGTLRDFGVEPATLAAVLETSDVIFVVASVTSENGGFLGAKEFAAMRQGASFVLLSRAGVVDFEALMEAVRSGHIKAASDVFPEEPLAGNHGVRGLENFVLSAHRAGALDAAFKVMGHMVLDDLDLMSRGLPPVACRRAERETVRRMRSKPVTRN